MQPGPPAPAAAAPRVPAAPAPPPRRRNQRSGRDDALAAATAGVLAAAGPARGRRRRGCGLAAQDSTAAVPATRAAAAAGFDRPAPAPAPAPRGGRPRHAARHAPWWWTGCVAVVGNRPVLASQVDEEVFSRQSQGQQLPDRPRLARRRSASRSSPSIVDEELLVQQAQRDTTIKVTDQEIADGVEQQVRKVRANFGSEVDYKSELKKAGFRTPEEYRRWLTDQQRRAAFQNRLIDKLRQDGKLKPVPPTEQEMRAYFDEQKGNLGSAPGDALVPADRHRAARRRPRPRRSTGRRPTRSCSSSGAAPTSPPRPSGSRRTRAPRTRAARSTGSGAG